MKIVILDDSLTIRMIIEAYLEDIGVEEDYIFSFGKGVEALDFIKENGADIIFTDIEMPGMNGYEFVKNILEINPLFVNSLFVVSGNDDKKAIRKMKLIGAHRFIKKPIEISYFNHFIIPEIKKRLVNEYNK